MNHIEKYINLFIQSTTIQASTLKSYLDAIQYASRFAEVHKNVNIHKVESKVFYLKKMLTDLSHSRQAYLQEQFHQLPDFSEVSKMRSPENVCRFEEYATAINADGPQQNLSKHARTEIEKKIDWCTAWIASTICLESMQRPGAVQNVLLSEFDRARHTLYFGLVVLEASKHKTARKGKASLVLDSLLLRLLTVYIEKIRPHINGSQHSRHVFLTSRGGQLTKLSAKMYKVTCFQ